MRGWLGKAGYGESDVACILVCISSIMRVRGPTAKYDSHNMHTFIDRGIITLLHSLTVIAHYSHSIPDRVVFIIHQWR